ncbi:hypothetical protein GCM10009504_24400 [Pseudomonas laurentiana]|nr:hypothetical protein GCM10009504_24400 [Pseudomonas laurentiana]
MQVVFVRLVEQVEDRAVLWVDRGADATRGLVQHEVAQWSAGLHKLIIDFDSAELAHIMPRFGDRDAIDTYAALCQQQANVLTVVAGQVTEETVEAHGARRGQYRVRSLALCSVLGCLQLVFYLGAARAQAGFVTQLGWQRF